MYGETIDIYILLPDVEIPPQLHLGNYLLSLRLVVLVPTSYGHTALLFCKLI